MSDLGLQSINKTIIILLLFLYTLLLKLSSLLFQEILCFDIL